MSNAPRKTNRRQDLNRWDDEGGAPRSGHHFDVSHPSSLPHAELELYYFNIRTASGVIEDPEGDTCASLQAAREMALARARDIIAEGDRIGEDRRSWCVEIMNRANEQVLTIPFVNVIARL